MKLGIFSDVHIHNFQAFAKPSTTFQGINTRAEACFNALLEVGQIAQRESLDALLFCGDLFHTRGSLSVPLIRVSQFVIGHLCSIAPLYAISGNHDYASKHGDSASSVEIFEDIQGFTCLDASTDVDTMSAVIAGVSHGGDYRQLRSVPNGKFGIMILHTTFEGTQISNSYIAESGDDIFELKDFMKENGYRMCFVGDIHKRQNLGDSVWYVGSLLQQSFGEDQTKGMLIADTEKNSIRFIEIQSPQFITCSYSEFKQYDNSKDYYLVSTESESEYGEAKTVLGSVENVLLTPPVVASVKKRAENITIRSDPMEGLKAWMNMKSIPKNRQKEMQKIARGVLADSLS